MSTKKTYTGELDDGAVVLPEGAPGLEVGEFPLDSFPPILRAYAQSLSATYEVPAPLYLGMMLGALSGAAGKGFQLSGGASGWSNYANLFLLFGLETGAGKSVVNAIVQPIQAEQSRRKREWECERLPVLKAHLERLKKELKDLGKEAGQSDRNRLAKEIALKEGAMVYEPALMLGSCTTAALAKNLQNMEHETALLFSPEAGDLVRVALGLYRETGMDADLLLSGFTGEPYAQSRAGTGNADIKNPCLSILGMVQPSIIREVLEHKEAKERGLLGRFLFLPLSHPLVPDGGNRPPIGTDERARWETLLERVLKMRLESKGSPHPVECTGGAKEVFRVAHNESVEWINGQHQDLRAWLVRYREQALRVALCLHLAKDPGSTQLSEETARRAVAFVRWSVAQLFEMLHSSRSESLRERLQEMAAIVSGSEYVTFRDLRRGGFEEAEVRQLCVLSGGELEHYVHTPARGGTRSPRVRINSGASVTE
jgi:replicative DNA helicase